MRHYLGGTATQKQRAYSAAVVTQGRRTVRCTAGWRTHAQATMPPARLVPSIRNGPHFQRRDGSAASSADGVIRTQYTRKFP